MSYDRILPFDSNGMENLLNLLSPNGSPKGRASFPRDWKLNPIRIEDSENVERWFLRVANNLGGVDSFLLEKNLACFAVIKWTGEQIDYANIQIIRSRKPSLEEWYCEQKPEDYLDYLRLDYDLAALGPMFSHPHPHIHAKFTDAPRFCLGLSSGRNVVMDFFDFVYRNYEYKKWRAWAESVVLANNPRREARVPFSVMEDAYKTGPHDLVLDLYRDSVENAKAVLSEWKDKKYHYYIDHDKCRLLGY